MEYNYEKKVGSELTAQNQKQRKSRNERLTSLTSFPLIGLWTLNISVNLKIGCQTENCVYV